MKEICLIFTLAISTLLSNQIHAQCQPQNGDFEIWTDYTDSIAEELQLVLSEQVLFPEGWWPLGRLLDIALSDFIVPYFDLDTLDLDVFASIRQYQPGADGTGSALAISGDSLVLGSDLIQVFECGSSPTSMSGMVKYVGSGQDSLTIIALLHNSDLLDEEGAIAVATYETQGGPEEFVQFEVDFDYAEDVVPDSASILIISKKPFEMSQDTSYFVLDDLSFDTESTPTIDVNSSEVLVGPNPTSDILFVTGQDIQRLRIVNLTGQVVRTAGQVSSGESLNVGNLPEGVYTVLAEKSNGLFSQRISIMRSH